MSKLALHLFRNDPAALTTATRFSDAVTADGEHLLGIADLYDAVMDHLDTISFAITTRYQKRMTLLQFWLTVVFGATQMVLSPRASPPGTTRKISVRCWRGRSVPAW